jgi:FtsP/CotA-like multicopper oxidase with cupredoxin domain
VAGQGCEQRRRGGEHRAQQKALIPSGIGRRAHRLNAPSAKWRLPYFAAAMTRNQRIALVVAAVAVAVLAFVIAQPGDDEDGGQQAATTPAQTDTGGTADGGTAGGGAEAPPETEEEPPPPPEPDVTRIRIRGGEVVGGAQDIEVTRGDTVRIVVTSDAPDEIHLHGYDITRNPAPGRPARFRFRADAEGAFEIESHVAEDAGKDPLVARLVVEPS